MAIRKCFISTPDNDSVFTEIDVEFDYYGGFAVVQKQKSIKSLHENILKKNNNLKVLEISTKSPEPLGVELSAFNLRFFDENSQREYAIENVFQASKVFENGGPYTDLLYVHPRDAKRDERLTTSGKLLCFRFQQKEWKLIPKTMFYDWIYITSLVRNKRLAREILEYNAFTDIEFNHNKSINCQARAAAIFVSLAKENRLKEVVEHETLMEELYTKNCQENGIDQLSMWDK